MIGALRGRLARKAPEGLLVDVAGVGYAVVVPLSTFYDLPDQGADVRLLIHTHVRDTAIELFGFRTRAEQELFEALIGVSGIGPKLAVTILSGMESDALITALANQDVARLTTIPGVGKKTAERLALELRDRALKVVPAGATGSSIRDDVLSALLNLGYKRRDAESALKLVDDNATEFEEILRHALRALAR